MLDFGKLGGKSLDTVLSPTEIFNLLTTKDAKYQYPRDVQGQVWDAWFKNRNVKDSVIQMNTGGGKTMVGLLLLKSCLNESIRPAVYLVPDNYLVGQVLTEAKALGIAITDDLESPGFTSGKQILVTNIKTLINGISRFGTADTGPKIAVGALLVDDAHACLAGAEDQFTIKLSATTPAYKALFHLFEGALRDQNEAGVIDLKLQDPQRNMLVPFWAWQQHSARVLEILSEHRKSDEIKWGWGLLKNHISLCDCVFGAGELEISIPCLPMEAIPAFAGARRRIFMTATMSDDSVLVTAFDADPKLVVNHLTPDRASDIGDRMILVPQEINPSITDTQMKAWLRECAKKVNIVVIVPSGYRAEFWRDVADAQVTAKNASEEVKKLKAGHVGLVVFINKYDGVDLPDEACRILVLDGLPKARRRIEQIEYTYLAGSKELLIKQLQRIEQGMGRGVRSNEDHCAVVLMGFSLISNLRQLGAEEVFSPAARAQLALGNKVAEQLAGKGLTEIENTMRLCLDQDPDWKKAAKAAVVDVVYADHGHVSDIAQATRAAFNHVVIGSVRDAEDALQAVIASTTDAPSRGWLKQLTASVLNRRDPILAQRMLKSALTDNRRLLKPIDGIEYELLKSSQVDQATKCHQFIDKYKGQPNSLILHGQSIVDRLKFQPDSAESFERAVEDAGELLGFAKQRPDRDFKLGPDVLWAVGGLKFFLIECKSEATTALISKAYTNQVLHHVQWFKHRYDATCSHIPILMHPSYKFDYHAIPPPDLRMMGQNELEKLSTAISSFVAAVANQLPALKVEAVAERLVHFNLTPTGIVSRFTADFKRSE